MLRQKDENRILSRLKISTKTINTLKHFLKILLTNCTFCLKCAQNDVKYTSFISGTKTNMDFTASARVIFFFVRTSARLTFTHDKTLT